MKHGNPLSRITYSSVSLMPSLFRTLEFNDFSLVVCKPDRNVIYSGCQWSQMQESAEVGGNVMEKVTVEAARRTETSL